MPCSGRGKRERFRHAYPLLDGAIWKGNPRSVPDYQMVPRLSRLFCGMSSEGLHGVRWPSGGTEAKARGERADRASKRLRRPLGDDPSGRLQAYRRDVGDEGRRSVRLAVREGMRQERRRRQRLPPNGVYCWPSRICSGAAEKMRDLCPGGVLNRCAHATRSIARSGEHTWLDRRTINACRPSGAVLSSHKVGRRIRPHRPKSLALRIPRTILAHRANLAFASRPRLKPPPEVPEPIQTAGFHPRTNAGASRHRLAAYCHDVFSFCNVAV